tara:strand:- start:49 stop:1875 length:1827 start_codon:yes stop_codon:yes gene_type:complete
LAQDRFVNLRNQLEVLTADSPGLEEKVDFSVGETIELADFLVGLGKSSDVNISVDPNVKGKVINNLSNVTVLELLVFLAKQHKLDFDITGNIIHIKPFEQEVEVIAKIRKPISIKFDTINSLLSLELKQDSLPLVTRSLTQKTGKNIVFQPGLESKLLSIYLQDVLLEQGLEQIAFANDLQITKNLEGFYLIEKLEKNKNQDPSSRFQSLAQNSQSSIFEFDSGFVSLTVENEPIKEVVRSIFQEMGLDYFLFSKLDGTITLSVQNVSLSVLLQRIFSGTKYTFREKDGVVIIGERTEEGLRESKRIFLQHRSVEKIIEYIPENIRSGLSIKEFTELNSLLVSGSYPQIMELERFIINIDQPVPVVLIEVIIIDYQKNHNLSTGIEAGVGEEPGTSGGSVYPGFDYSLNANSLNTLIQNFDGFGSLNLGPVTPNFYVNLRLLEDNGVLNVRSTPKLSTLNGHEASISIGSTQYYVNQQASIQGAQSPVTQVTRTFQSVQANFTLTVKPFVAGDSSVTLEIQVDQSDFTARESPDAPPGAVNRNFNSMIRVKNGEMILLGGLEEKTLDDSGSGIPFLSRIPILKYLFSSRTTNDKKSKLNIFIKPSIIY